MLFYDATIRPALRILVAAAVLALLFGRAPVLAVPEAGVVEPYLIDAQAYLDAGEIRAAIALLKTALQQDPENIQARYILGAVYIEAQDGASAEKELRTAYDQGFDESQLRERLAEALLIQGKFKSLLREIEADDPDPERRAALLSSRGRAYFGLRQLDEAEAEYRKAFSASPDYVEAKTGLARVLIAKGDTDAALEMIEEALGIDENSVGAKILQGELARMSRDFDLSVTAFGEALALRPNNIEALLGQASALIDMDRDQEAQRNIDAALELSPRHPLALYLSGLMLTKQQSYVGAEAVLNRAGSALDDYLPALYLRGTIAYAQGNLEQAFYHLSRFVEQAPSHVNGRRLLGGTLVRQGQFAEATEVFAPIVDNPDIDARVLALAASAHMGIRDYEAAVDLYERAVNVAPDESLYRTQLAVARLATGDQSGGLEELEAVVETDPTARRAPLLLARHSLVEGDTDTALSIAQQFVDGSPEDPAAHNLMGAALRAKGDVPGATAAFEKALEINPAFFPAVQNLARLEIAEQDIEAAVNRYQAYHELYPDHEEAMIELARLSLQSGDEAAAIEWLETAAAAVPNSPRASLMLINRYIAKENSVRALAIASALDQRLPDRAEVIEALARAQRSAGDTVSAVITYGRLAELAPERADVFVALGRAQLSTGDVFNARSSYRRALELDPTLIQPVLELVTLELDNERYRSAMEVAVALQEAQPQLPLGDILVGLVHGRSGDSASAIASFKAAEPKVNSVDSALRLYHAYQEIDEQTLAAGVLESWLNDNPDQRSVRGLLAGAYLEAGDYERSIHHHKQLQEDDPGNPMILNNLAWLYQSIGDPRAVALAEEAYKIMPEAVIVMDTYGWIMVEHGRVEEGATVLEEASALAPDEPDIQYHLALARLQQGRDQEACALLRTILSVGSGFTRRDEAETLSDAHACR